MELILNQCTRILSISSSRPFELPTASRWNSIPVVYLTSYPGTTFSLRRVSVDTARNAECEVWLHVADAPKQLYDGEIIRIGSSEWLVEEKRLLDWAPTGADELVQVLRFLQTYEIVPLLPFLSVASSRAGRSLSLLWLLDFGRAHDFDFIQQAENFRSVPLELLVILEVALEDLRDHFHAYKSADILLLHEVDGTRVMTVPTSGLFVQRESHRSRIHNIGADLALQTTLRNQLTLPTLTSYYDDAVPTLTKLAIRLGVAVPKETCQTPPTRTPITASPSKSPESSSDEASFALPKLPRQAGVSHASFGPQGEDYFLGLERGAMQDESPLVPPRASESLKPSLAEEDADLDDNLLPPRLSPDEAYDASSESSAADPVQVLDHETTPHRRADSPTTEMCSAAICCPACGIGPGAVIRIAGRAYALVEVDAATLEPVEPIALQVEESTSECQIRLDVFEVNAEKRVEHVDVDNFSDELPEPMMSDTPLSSVGEHTPSQKSPDQPDCHVDSLTDELLGSEDSPDEPRHPVVAFTEESLLEESPDKPQYPGEAVTEESLLEESPDKPQHPMEAATEESLLEESTDQSECLVESLTDYSVPKGPSLDGVRSAVEASTETTRNELTETLVDSLTPRSLEEAPYPSECAKESTMDDVSVDDVATPAAAETTKPPQEVLQSEVCVSSHLVFPVTDPRIYELCPSYPPMTSSSVVGLSDLPLLFPVGCAQAPVTPLLRPLSPVDLEDQLARGALHSLLHRIERHVSTPPLRPVDFESEARLAQFAETVSHELMPNLVKLEWVRAGHTPSLPLASSHIRIDYEKHPAMLNPSLIGVQVHSEAAVWPTDMTDNTVAVARPVWGSEMAESPSILKDRARRVLSWRRRHLGLASEKRLAAECGLTLRVADTLVSEQEISELSPDRDVLLPVASDFHGAPSEASCFIHFQRGSWWVSRREPQPLGCGFDNSVWIRKTGTESPAAEQLPRRQDLTRLQFGDVFKLRNVVVRVERFLVGVGGCQGVRLRMEDEELVMHDIPFASDLPISLYGVYDGHGGRECASWVKRELHKVFLRQLSLGWQGHRFMHREVYRALFSAFVLTDRGFLHRMEIEQKEAGPGSAVVGVAIVGDLIFCANAGDSRAVLCRAGRAINLSDDHKPDNPTEHERIIGVANGFVRNKRVLGRLAVSRALGDREYKRVGTGVQPLIVSEPEVRVEAMNEHDEFILVACDGLFDVFSSQQAIDFCRQSLLRMDNMDPQRVAFKLVEDAVDIRKSRDNVTALLIMLKTSFS
ncbi:MAG: hypothetical protein KVP17_000400 [Porospora cf. gigantea B]|uniref:uncharacterized protein n=1 Tax=Porospora cf. gigantea B TaxID=2853592 RepID=UPI003571EE8C|nr:MAG: hypothetical protein KVP17_000400 [Porospora cf. gigantea B]